MAVANAEGVPIAKVGTFGGDTYQLGTSKLAMAEAIAAHRDVYPSLFG